MSEKEQPPKTEQPKEQPKAEQPKEPVFASLEKRIAKLETEMKKFHPNHKL
jgi:hypothetical protein